MARTALPGRLNWLLAAVNGKRRETDRATTVRLVAAAWPGHLAGQHVDVRLTAEDGYQAQRSYSIASAPHAGWLELTIEEIADGEVSPYLVEELREGDQVELRGPIGGYFTWTENDGGPLFLIAGGSGIVPLMSMLRYRAEIGADVPATLIYSARDWDDVIYREELAQLATRPGLRVAYTLTRAQPENWRGFSRRIDRAMIEDVGAGVGGDPRVFICGPTPLVESVANTMVSLGYPTDRVKTERFGPTGGQ